MSMPVEGTGSMWCFKMKRWLTACSAFDCQAEACQGTAASAWQKQCCRPIVTLLRLQACMSACTQAGSSSLPLHPVQCAARLFTLCMRGLADHPVPQDCRLVCLGPFHCTIRPQIFGPMLLPVCCCRQEA